MADRYDLSASEVRADPWRLYAELREEPGVHRVGPLDHFLVARHSDVVAALERVDDFSSLEMARQLGPIDALGSMMGGEARDLPPTIISSDNPVHNRLRLIMQGRFSPRAVATIEGPIRALTDSLIADIVEKGECDLVRDFTIPLPVIVIAQLLGIDQERFEDFKRWSDALVAIASARGEERQRQVSEITQLAQYFLEMSERRRCEPGDDLLSVLVGAEQEGDRISRGEVLAFAVLLMVAGNETTTNLIGGMVETLIEFPEQLEKLVADPRLTRNAVEEGLRYCSPVQGLFRNATRDVDLAGTRIPEGAPLMVCYASANRDPAVFPDPDRFDIGRDARRHVAFGRGLHFCLGANLARREARIAIEKLLPHLSRFRRTREERDWVDSWFLRGPKTLPLALD